MDIMGPLSSHLGFFKSGIQLDNLGGFTAKVSFIPTSQQEISENETLNMNPNDTKEII
jgi:hypothetical protein